MRSEFSKSSVRSLLRGITGSTADRCIVSGGSCKFSNPGCPSTCWVTRLDRRIASFKLDVHAMEARRRNQT